MRVSYIPVVLAAAICTMSPLYAQPKPPTGPAPKPAMAVTVPDKPAAVPPWDGRWNGTFGARSDVAVLISSEKVTGVTILGQPMAVSSATISGLIATISGPDFSLTMTRIGPTNATGVYENNRKEKASVLLTRG